MEEIQISSELIEKYKLSLEEINDLTTSIEANIKGWRESNFTIELHTDYFMITKTDARGRTIISRKWNFENSACWFRAIKEVPR